ncbi:hypothetical protein [Kistimonas asteriae]|uniref:hypothetical protein n=1 Tax=Kistimonas asteriae TaxID=517724 RepID=UPI001BA7E716|nr:hypothetical protein [Kistimonas asteriae]
MSVALDRTCTVSRPEIEWAESNDPCLDYCLWPYEPRCSQSGKLRSINLLHASFQQAGAEQLVDICQAIRDAVGDFQTVWGIKQSEKGFSWELYFYDYERLQRRVSASRLIDVLSPWLSCDLAVNENSPYFMFSLNLEPETGHNLRSLDSINIYMGNAGSNVSSGLSYSLTADGLIFDNLYSFFDARNEQDDILAKMACSAHLSLDSLNPDDVLWPELVDCQTIVVANKRLCEGIYFSRVTVDQLLFFLRKTHFPAAHVAYVEKNRDRLEHLLFDVGFDYTMVEGTINITKSAYYGVF